MTKVHATAKRILKEMEASGHRFVIPESRHDRNPRPTLETALAAVTGIDPVTPLRTHTKKAGAPKRPRTFKTGDVLETGSWMNTRIWLVEKITPKGTVSLARLRWSTDLIGESGVMRRTTQTITARLKDGYLVKRGVGTFSHKAEPIKIKTDRIEEPPQP